MNNKKSSFFNLDGYQVAIIMWIASMLLLFNDKRWVGILLPFLILVFEKKSAIVRNHAGQLLILNILVFVVSLLFSTIIAMIVALVSWIPLFNVATYTLIAFVRFLITALFFANHLIGFIKATRSEVLSLPLIGHLGDRFSQEIRF
ncbi:MAG TPA: hypothetical protein VIG45_06380 [Erysipelothrix sp.]